MRQRTSGFTKYRLHNRIPANAAEAERFLWHALEHRDNLENMTVFDLDAKVILRRAICELQDPNVCSCK